MMTMATIATVTATAPHVLAERFKAFSWFHLMICFTSMFVCPSVRPSVRPFVSVRVAFILPSTPFVSPVSLLLLMLLYRCSLRIVNSECQWMIASIIYQYVSGRRRRHRHRQPLIYGLWRMRISLSVCVCVFATASLFFSNVFSSLCYSLWIYCFSVVCTFVPFHHLSIAVSALDCYI